MEEIKICKKCDKEHTRNNNLCLKCQKRKERISVTKKIYYKKNKKYIKEYKKEWQLKNKERLAQKAKIWRKNNKQRINEYHINRKKNDIEYKLLCSLRVRLNRAVTSVGVKKSNSTMNLVGCSIKELKEYIQSKFMPGMTFDNYGVGDDKWSIDHIIPCSAFDLSDPKQQKECFGFENLSPLWNKDNFSKNSLYNGKYIRNRKK